MQQDELDRTAVALMGFRPTVRACVDLPSSDDTSDVGGLNTRPSSLTQRPQSLLESPMTCSTKSGPVHDPRLPHSPEAINIHPNQFAFLSTVGEMARRVAQQQRGGAGDRIEKDGTPLMCCTVSALPHQELQLSVDTLVQTEGQRVRLRLVPAGSFHHQGDRESAKRLEEEEEGVCRVYKSRHDVAISLCTILSSFAPPEASYWEDDRLVEPYLGKCYGPSTQRRSNKSDENNGLEWDDDGGSGVVDEENSNNNISNVDDDVSCLNDDPNDSAGFNEAHDPRSRHRSSATAMRSYEEMLTHNRCRNDPVFHNAFFLDTGNITGGERRKKLIVLHSYRASVISFVDKKVLKKDINNDFYVQHPELEIREIKLTHMRKIRADLLNFALEDNSPLEVVTVAYANWYFERLIMRGMVGKRNRRVVLAACILLAIKFVETGDIHKKIHYAKSRFRQDEAFAGVTWKKVQEWEFRAYVGLEFTLMPENSSTVVDTHVERLLGQINLTSQEYYSKKFALP